MAKDELDEKELLEEISEGKEDEKEPAADEEEEELFKEGEEEGKEEPETEESEEKEDKDFDVAKKGIDGGSGGSKKWLIIGIAGFVVVTLVLMYLYFWVF